MTILFLHGMESGPSGKKARYLQEKYPSKVCVPDLQISFWRLDKKNSVFRRLLKLLYEHPFWLVTKRNGLLKAAALDSLTKCADIAVREIRNLGNDPLQLLIGSSWGATVALCLLARGDWKGPTLLIAPALKRVLLMDISEDEGVVREQMQRWYENIKSNLSGVDRKSKIIVVHGSSDDMIPLEHSQELCEAIDAGLIVVPGGDHRLNDCLLNQNKFQELVGTLCDIWPPVQPNC